MEISALKKGDRFRTLLSKWEGTVVRSDSYGVRVYWHEKGEEQTVHPHITVEKLDQIH